MPGESPAARRFAAGWLLLALLALGLSTACALLLVAARVPLPGGAIAPVTLFRSTLVLHVGLAVVVWFLSGAAAMWTLAGGGGSRMNRVSLVLAYAGVAAMIAAPFASNAAPVLANYVPVLDSPLFLLGLGGFFSGVALCALTSMPALWRQLRQPQTAVWRVAAALSMVAALLALGMLAALLLASGLPAQPSRYETLAWGPGHVLQFVHILLLMGVWTILGEHALGGAFLPRRLLLALLTVAAAPLLVAPAIAISASSDSVAFRQGFTHLMAWASWPAPATLGVLLLVRLVRAGRAGHGGWHTAAALPLLLSILLFLFGCALGASIRSESTMVPAHYHGTVGAVTLAYMALGYRLLAQYGAAVGRGRLVRWQPVIYGVGLMLLAAALAWSGWLGVPRKTPHVDVIVQYPAYFVAMGLAGLGGFLAVSGAALFVFNAAKALRGARLVAAPQPRWAALSGAGALLACSLLSACLPGDRSTEAPSLTGASDPERHIAQKRKEEVASRFANAAALLNAKQFQEAANELHHVLALEPRLPEAHVNMGFAMIGLENYALARDFFQSAIELRANQVNAYYGLAEALEGLHDMPGALGAMRTYVHLSKPDDPYLARANSAIWEWESQLEQSRNGGAARASLPESGNEGVAYPIREKSLR